MTEVYRTGFDRLDYATVESGLVPKVDELFKARGIQTGYFVFDAHEISRGFPVTVKTRYIFPVPWDEKRKWFEKYAPGLMLSEILGLGERTLKIQIGLGEEDLWKLEKRGTTIWDREKGITDYVVPAWWNFPSPAIDMTRSYDLEDHLEPYIQKRRQPASPPIRLLGVATAFFQRLTSSPPQAPLTNEDIGIPIDAYLWGRPNRNKEMVSVVFEKQGNHAWDVVVNKWKRGQKEVERGLKSMEEEIGRL